MIKSNVTFLRVRRLFSSTAATVEPVATGGDGNIQFRNEYWENEQLSRLCYSNLYKEAMEAFFSFQSQRPNFPIYPITYRHLFRAASNLKSPVLCRQIHDHLSLSGVHVHHDVILQNHILHAYGRCGLLEDAEVLFDEMAERNTVSWTEMIASYASNLREEEAIEMYVAMRQLGFRPDEFTLGSVMGACSRIGDVELGREIHGDALKLGCGSKRLVQNSLITMYAKSGSVDGAWSVFGRIREKNVVSWGAMISCFANQSHGFEALFCFREMLRSGEDIPNEIIFEAIFRACAVFPRLEPGEQIHGLCSKSGVGGSAFAGCSLIDMYAKFGRLDCSKNAFYNIEIPDLVAWNLIISIFAQRDESNLSLSLFSEMRTSSNIHPNDTMVRHLLAGLKTQACLHQGQQVHSLIIKTGSINDTAVSNSLLTMYTWCSDHSNARFLFEEMGRNRDLVSVNVFLRGCVHHDQPKEVFNLLKLVHDSGYKPDEITFNIMFRACADLSSLETTLQVHAYSLKLGFESNLVVTYILLYTYAKCGNLQDARLLSKIMGNALDVVSWSSLICGYAQYGLGKEVVELFIEMQRSPHHVKPNEVTLLGVLSACNRAGLVNEGWNHFEVMQKEHGITPTREHFSCMIDMLSRAGHLKEAKKLIDSMPFKPDIVVWKSLLSGCCVHGNFEIGEDAAEYILKLEPSNSMAYASLCNIYALDGNWKEVARLRNRMRSSGLKKFAGKSWVDVKGEVHDFVIEDRTHPYTKEIYTLLEALEHEMNESDSLLA